MIQRISVPVSVVFQYDHKTQKALPRVVQWEGQRYLITKIGFHHTFIRGRTLFHVFSVESPNLSFKLEFNTETLQWRLEEISDGLPD